MEKADNICKIDLSLDVDKVKRMCPAYLDSTETKYNCTNGSSICTPTFCTKYKEVETEYKLNLAEKKLKKVMSICEEAISTYDNENFFADDEDTFLGESILAQNILEALGSIDAEK